MVFWLLGDLNGAPHWEIVWLALAIALAVVWPRARELDWLARSDAWAATLGVAVARRRRAVLLAAALATGAAVATAGAIGFVGLVVPHALRRLGVRAAPLLLPASAIGGGVFVVVVDAVARTIVAPLQLRSASSPRRSACRPSSRCCCAAARRPMSSALLEAEALALRAGGSARGRVLFERLDLRIAGGERWVVVGPNGAGKSSLLAALAGIFPIAAGAVRIDAYDLGDGRRRARRRAARGARSSGPTRFRRPCARPLRSRASATPAGGAARRATSTPRSSACSTSAPVRPRRERRADALGRRAPARRARDRAAAGTPLLLLDEPASHLDLAHQRLLVAVLLAHAAAGGAVVASLHDLNLAWDLASHVVSLDGAGHALAGTRDEVLGAERLGAVFGVPIHAVALERRSTLRHRRRAAALERSRAMSEARRLLAGLSRRAPRGRSPRWR
jgi:ABC-type cobalamin/Fe3+-siderophores transport system ATPase subunit